MGLGIVVVSIVSVKIVQMYDFLFIFCFIDEVNGIWGRGIELCDVEWICGWGYGRKRKRCMDQERGANVYRVVESFKPTNKIYRKKRKKETSPFFIKLIEIQKFIKNYHSVPTRS